MVCFGWLRRAFPGLLFAIVMLLQHSPSFADSLPPLQANKAHLKSLLYDRLADIALPPYPVLRPDAPFDTISPYVAGLENLAQFGLVTIPDDGSAVLDFLELSLTTRLRELGILGKVRVRPLTPFAEGFDDCGTLGMAVFFGARETTHDGRPVMAVMITTFLWQLVPEPGSSKYFSTCSADKGPSLTAPGVANVFLVEPGDREKTLALAKEALLSIVDQAILSRLIETNATAMQRVKSWAEWP